MSKKCNLISFGEINRYILLIFIGAILQVCFSFTEDMSKFIHEGNISLIIYIIIYPLGSTLSFILLLFYKAHNKRKNKNILQYKI